jgi:NADPH:quinone reductase-like Zn-dependent oxidoreductase
VRGRLRRVGKATFPASLDCLKPFGMFASFGSASGPIDAFNIGLLAQKGSLFATRPTLFTHTAKREVLDEMAADLFQVGDDRRREDPRARPRQARGSRRRPSSPRGSRDHRRDGDVSVGPSA